MCPRVEFSDTLYILYPLFFSSQRTNVSGFFSFVQLSIHAYVCGYAYTLYILIHMGADNRVCTNCKDIFVYMQTYAYIQLQTNICIACIISSLCCFLIRLSCIFVFICEGVCNLRGCKCFASIINQYLHLHKFTYRSVYVRVYVTMECYGET